MTPPSGGSGAPRDHRQDALSALSRGRGDRGTGGRPAPQNKDNFPSPDGRRLQRPMGVLRRGDPFQFEERPGNSPANEAAQSPPCPPSTGRQENPASGRVPGWGPLASGAARLAGRSSPQLLAGSQGQVLSQPPKRNVTLPSCRSAHGAAARRSAGAPALLCGGWGLTWATATTMATATATLRWRPERAEPPLRRLLLAPVWSWARRTQRLEWLTRAYKWPLHAAWAPSQHGGLREPELPSCQVTPDSRAAAVWPLTAPPWKVTSSTAVTQSVAVVTDLPRSQRGGHTDRLPLGGRRTRDAQPYLN